MELLTHKPKTEANNKSAPTGKGNGQKIPQEKNTRNNIRDLVNRYVIDKKLIPPLSLKELFSHADKILQKHKLHFQYRDFITVLIGNAIWENTVASVPFNRRVLLLPQCLRNKTTCPAEVDSFGLLCEQCGRCVTGELQSEAEALGYVVLIAEGTTVVTTLLESGQVDCVIGASCLSSLERSFPYTAAAAIPGLAIPLFQEGCDNTKVDVEWLRESIRLRSDKDWTGRLNLDQLRAHVNSWFEPGNISNLLELSNTDTERYASEWMTTGGKRWRPFLATCVYKTVTGLKSDIPEDMKKLAVAVECFHKASLVHDDIEDDDTIRYGMPTLHRKYGMPVALNIGDLLIGEGYRLIS